MKDMGYAKCCVKAQKSDLYLHFRLTRDMQCTH